jgi:hypothetical protein
MMAFEVTSNPNTNNTANATQTTRTKRRRNRARAAYNRGWRQGLVDGIVYLGIAYIILVPLYALWVGDIKIHALGVK